MKYSFIVPVYNSEIYLKRCLDSLINQSYNNYEIIIIDNNSKDSSLSIVREYIKKNNNIKLYFSKSKKVGLVRNLGIKKSTGNFFITIDSDDIIESNLLEIINSVITDKTDIVRFNAFSEMEKEMFATNLEPGTYSGKICLEYFIDEYIKYNKIFGPSWLYGINKQFYIENNFKFKNYFQEDFGLIPQVLFFAKTMVVINKQLYNYIYNNNGITNNRNNSYKKAKDILYHYDNHINFANKNMFDVKSKKKFEKYLKTTLIRKYKKLNNYEQILYIKELEKRGINNEDIIDDHYTNL